MKIFETEGTGMTPDSINDKYCLANKEDWSIDDVLYNNVGGLEFNAIYLPTNEVVNFKFKSEEELNPAGGQWVLDELNSQNLVDDQFDGDTMQTIEIQDVQDQTDDGLKDVSDNLSNDQIDFSQATERDYIEDGDNRGDGLNESTKLKEENIQVGDLVKVDINKVKQIMGNEPHHIGLVNKMISKADNHTPYVGDVTKNGMVGIRSWRMDILGDIYVPIESVRKINESITSIKEENINHMSLHDWNSIIQSIDAQMIHMHPEFGEIEFSFNNCHYLIELEGDELNLCCVEDVDSIDLTDEITDVDIAQQLSDMMDTEEEFVEAFVKSNLKEVNSPYGQHGSVYIPSPETLKAYDNAAKIAKKFGAGSPKHIKALQQAIAISSKD
jgi:hypothetical protein